MDRAHRATDREIRKAEKRLRQEYRQAANEIEKKANDYFRRFRKKDATWQRWVEEKKKTKEEYLAWRRQQILVGKRWNDLKDQLANDMYETGEKAKDITRGHVAETYAINANWATYTVEQQAAINTAFTLYDKEFVESMMIKNPQLLPKPGKMVKKDIAAGRAKRWSRKKIQSVATQAILQGEAIPKVARRLAKEVCDSDYKAAIRNARTMMTGAQNAGRHDAYLRAQNMGINIKQTWIATLDNRTRHSHRQLDGETIELTETFSNGCRFPGDPLCEDASEVYNCRCTTIIKLNGYERDVQGYTIRSDLGVKNMSYDQWKASKKSKSRPIDSQYKKGKAIKAKYIWEYRNL